MSDILHAPVTLILMALSVALSIYGFNAPKVLEALLLDVSDIRRRGQVWRMITAGFLHGDYFHLLLNMWTLYVFGPSLEVGVGADRYLILYFGSLLGGSALSVLENWRKPNYRALGASGAISGLTVCFSVFQPMVMFLIPPVPAIIYTVGFIAFSAYAASRFGDSGIGHTGHLGGALAGLAITCLLFPDAVRALPDRLADGFANFPSLF